MQQQKENYNPKTYQKYIQKRKSTHARQADNGKNKLFQSNTH